MSSPNNDKKDEPTLVKPMVQKVDKVIGEPTLKPQEEKDMILHVPPSIPVDMFSMLSKTTVKVPLSKMFRIEEHKNKALAWIKGVGQKNDVGTKRVVDEKAKIAPKYKECECVISKIPTMYLDNVATSYVEDIDPFFSSLVVNGKTLEIIMIDLGASNTIIPFKIMEFLGLKVDKK